nr:hypothetical protein 90 [Pelagibacteraceae bacterium]
MPIINLCDVNTMSNLFQDKRTGKLVEFINKHDKEFAMVKDATGNITYVMLEQLVPYDRQKGRLAVVEAPQIAPEPEEKMPETVVPIEDTRLNLNTAPAEQIAKRLPGVGYATAKRIVELRMSMSGERFANLKQLENIPRVNWEQLIEEDLIFIS